MTNDEKIQRIKEAEELLEFYYPNSGLRGHAETQLQKLKEELEIK